MVGRRDCTALVQGVTRQVELVRSALGGEPDLAEVPVRGMLLFVDVEWPLFGAGFATGGVDVVPPGKAVAKVVAGGSLTADVAARAQAVLPRHSHRQPEGVRGLMTGAPAR